MIQALLTVLSDIWPQQAVEIPSLTDALETAERLSQLRGKAYERYLRNTAIRFRMTPQQFLDLAEAYQHRNDGQGGEDA